MATRYTRYKGLLMLVVSAFILFAAPVHAAPSKADCIVPAHSGGGFDLTCVLLADALRDVDVSTIPMPGGVGAVAFNTILNQRADDPTALVAFSEGSIYNLALGNYGPHGLDDVRWLAVMAMDYGAVLVRADAPWPDVQSMLTEASRQPQHIAVGGGGGIGGQDWTRVMLTADLAGIPRNQVRYVALEGGGNCIQALLAGFVQVCTNDVGDSQRAIDAGEPLKILGVYAPHRLDEPLSHLPTMREQGIALDWPILRGVYTGKAVDPAAIADWENTLTRMMATPEYAALLQKHHLHALPLTGDALYAQLRDLTQSARKRAAGLNIP